MMGRQPMIAGNWKMFKTPGEAVELARSIARSLRLVATSARVVICPPFTALGQVGEVIADSAVGLGAQDLHWEDEGAYTGEVSGPMLRDCGCKYVIVGHSERRQYCGDTDERVALKLRAAIRHGLRPILCVGEDRDQRDRGETESVVVGQLTAAVQGLPAEAVRGMIVAYEPVWAIGTGLAATADQAQGVHNRLRSVLTELYGNDGNVPVLYGGSVKPGNAGDFFGQPDVDGALVGGASLDPDQFLQIIAQAAS